MNAPREKWAKDVNDMSQKKTKMINNTCEMLIHCNHERNVNQGSEMVGSSSTVSKILKNWQNPTRARLW